MKKLSFVTTHTLDNCDPSLVVEASIDDFEVSHIHSINNSDDCIQCLISLETDFDKDNCDIERFKAFVNTYVESIRLESKEYLRRKTSSKALFENLKKSSWEFKNNEIHIRLVFDKLK